MAANANFGPIESAIARGHPAGDVGADEGAEGQGHDQGVVVNLNVVPAEEEEYNEPEIEDESEGDVDDEVVEDDEEDETYVQEESDGEAYASDDVEDWEEYPTGEDPVEEGGAGEGPDMDGEMRSNPFSNEREGGRSQMCWRTPWHPVAGGDAE